jgi:hypothetical protein
MELPGLPTRSPGTSRAPASGLKLMLAILTVFALLAGYGQWQRLQRPKVETVTIIPVPGAPASPSPNER